MANTPNVRFKGFADDWEQRKVGELIEEYKEITTCNNQYPALTSSRKGIFLQTEYFSGHQVASEDNTGYNIVPRGYFTYRHMSDDEIFYFNINDIVDNGIVSTLYPVFKAKDNEMDSYLLRYILNYGHEFRKYALLQKQGGSRTYMYLSKLNELEITIPKTFGEQNKISEFLCNLDHLITLHRRKCDEVRQLKKFMLQKMFPKSGELIPEIRFAGFTDAWEQRKLGDVFKEYSEKHHEELEPLTIIQGQGTVLRSESDRNLQYDKAGLVNYKLVNKEDFILHLRSFEGGLEVANSQGIVSPAYHIFHGDKTDSRFYYPFFRSHYFINVLLKPHVYGIRDGKSIDVEGMKEILIPYPQYEEQKAMGDYFTTLDNFINLHQRKCDELKEVKRYMLQNMFPQKG